MPAGRPTKYRPEMCDQLIERMGLGFSFEACCGYFQIARETGYNWLKAYPEFLDAKKQGESLSRDFWENVGICALESDKDKKFNAAVWIFTMKNRFGWTDKREITGSEGGPIQVSNLSSTEIDRKISELLTRLNPTTELTS